MNRVIDNAPVPYRVALTFAKKSEYVPYKVGACIARGRRILSAGCNQVKTHPMMLRFNNNFVSSLHAEMHACIGVDPEALFGSDIYVVRVRRDGSLGLSKPCKICREFLEELGIRRAFYSEGGDNFGVIRLN